MHVFSLLYQEKKQLRILIILLKVTKIPTEIKCVETCVYDAIVCSEGHVYT